MSSTLIIGATGLLGAEMAKASAGNGDHGAVGRKPGAGRLRQLAKVDLVGHRHRDCRQFLQIGGHHVEGIGRTQHIDAEHAGFAGDLDSLVHHENLPHKTSKA